MCTCLYGYVYVTEHEYGVFCLCAVSSDQAAWAVPGVQRCLFVVMSGTCLRLCMGAAHHCSRVAAAQPHKRASGRAERAMMSDFLVVTPA